MEEKFNLNPRTPMSNQHNARCRYCESVIIPSLTGCAANTLRLQANERLRTLPRRPLLIISECPGCGVREGEYHHEGCPKETCPNCRKALVTCDCEVLGAGYLPEVSGIDFPTTI